MEVLWFALAVALCVGLAWLGFRIEPHFVSKDGERFLCMGQRMNVQAAPLGRWRETRVVVDRTGGVQVDQKRHMRRTTTFWKVEARSPEAPKRKAVFLLRGHDDQGVPILLALKMPAKSRAVATMEALLPKRSVPAKPDATGATASTPADGSAGEPTGGRAATSAGDQA